MTDTSNPVPAPQSDLLPVEGHAAAPAKPGFRTSEFWLKVAALVLTALFASGVIPTSGIVAQVAAIAATMLGALGYTVSRTLVKNASMYVLLGVLLGALALPQTACGATAKSVEAGAKSALVNCTGQALGTTPALDLATLAAIANLAATERTNCTPATGGLNWKCVEADLLAQGKVLGGCTLVTMVKSATEKPTASALTAMSGPPAGVAELADFCAKAAPGAVFHLATGNSACP